jgi:hypothetical protein
LRRSSTVPSQTDAPEALTQTAAGHVDDFIVSIMRIFEMLELPSVDRFSFIARHTNPKLANQLGSICSAWEAVAQSVVHAEVTKHVAAHALAAKDALIRAIRHAALSGALTERMSSELSGGTASEVDPVMWVPVLPLETLQFLSALPGEVLSAEDTAWCERELAHVPSDAEAARFMWTIPGGTPSASGGRSHDDENAREANPLTAEEPIPDERVPAIAAALLTSATAEFARPPAHGPPLQFRPVYERLAENRGDKFDVRAELPAESRTVVSTARGSALGESTDQLDAALSEVLTVSDRVCAIYDRVRSLVRDSCLSVTARFGDIVSFRGTRVVAALQQDPISSLIREGDLDTLTREE